MSGFAQREHLITGAGASRESESFTTKDTKEDEDHEEDHLASFRSIQPSSPFVSFVVKNLSRSRQRVGLNPDLSSFPLGKASNER